jgi:serine phosphatase RsbU (regulator of sigma subunit)
MKRKITLLKLTGTVGIVLSLVLIVDAVVTYLHVAGHLVEDHLTREAGRYISELEVAARDSATTGPNELLAALDRFRRSYPGRIAWLRIADHKGDILTASGDSPPGSLRPEIVRALLDQRVQSVSKELQIDETSYLVVTLPFRFRFDSERMSPGLTGHVPGQPRFKLVEIGLESHGGDDPFRPLRRNLLISVTSAAALLAAMIGLLLLLRKYIRHQEIRQQLELARRVQAELLPSACPDCHPLDFAAEFRPYWEVGGDFYDIFRTDTGQTVILMGDVSGKGVAAALLMGVIHGAIRAYMRSGDTSDLARLAVRLNTQMNEQTRGGHFVTLFWGVFDPVSGRLHYVNCGHHPPLLVSANESPDTTRRLETGGPVLGLLPETDFEEGTVTLAGGDSLVLFSDGLVEAENREEEPFGEARLERVLLANRRQPADHIRQEVMAEVNRFMAATPLHDDLSLMVAQIRADDNPARSG